MADSPGSPLSDHSSDEFQDETRASIRSSSMDHFRDHDNDGDSTRPAKKTKLNGQMTSWDSHLPPAPHSDLEGDISSDTDGSVPGSPHPGAPTVSSAAARDKDGDDDDGGPAGGREQITVCKWDGCDAGDLKNMDLLVQHLHDEHIQARQKKYSCEWADCNRKGIAHASGYALRAHMRSHTREKPFYCSLPECDRSFTRSDALAKHMRTVHETEALRPSDPVPKHHSANPQNKSQRLKLTIKGLGKTNGNGADASNPTSAVRSNGSVPGSPAVHAHSDSEYEHHNVVFAPKKDRRSGRDADDEHDLHFPSDINFTPEELRLPPDQLYSLLTAQLAWSTDSAQKLQRTLDQLEGERRKEWISKELLLENLMESAFAKIERKMVRQTERPKGMEEMEARFGMKWDAVESRKLPIERTQEMGLPWWMGHRVGQAPPQQQQQVHPQPQQQVQHQPVASLPPPPPPAVPPRATHRATLDDLAAAAGI